MTECVRTYSVDLELDQITPIAQRHGLKVLQGLWLGRDPEFNRFQIETAVALTNRYPDVIRAIVVGNEVLLRAANCPPQPSRTSSARSKLRCRSR